MTKKRIAIFGSAFNPPTFGHMDAIESILDSQPPFDKVVLVPSYHHAFGKTMLAYEQRVALLNHFASSFVDKPVEVQAIEQHIAKSGKPVYTYHVLEFMQTELFPEDELTFVVGPDNLANWSKFYRAEDILKRWNRLVVPQRKDVRSTYVRDALEKGESVEKWIPPSVSLFIQQHGLYQ